MHQDKHDKITFQQYFSHLKSSKVGWEVVLLEGGGVEGDGVGQVDLPRLDLRHHVHQVQNLVGPFEKVGSIICMEFYVYFGIYLQ